MFAFNSTLFLVLHISSWVQTLSIFTQIIEYYSTSIIIGQVLNLVNSNTMIAIINGNSFLVYVLN